MAPERADGGGERMEAVREAVPEDGVRIAALIGEFRAAVAAQRGGPLLLDPDAAGTGAGPSGGSAGRG